MSSSTNSTIYSVSGLNAGYYFVSAQLNSCFSFDSTNVVINSPSIVTIDEAGPYCLNDNGVNLSTSIPDGIWSGVGITDSNLGTFNPEIAGVGIKLITYTLITGCGGSDSMNIIVNELPISKFTLTSFELDPFNPNLSVINQSSDSSTYNWDFGDNTFSNEFEPSHNYPFVSGDYEVELLVINSNGCKDSTINTISIPDVLLYYVPNTFSPNGDELNNVFKPIFTEGFNPKNYHLEIYNRWGNLVFESFDAAVGWDGTLDQLGNIQNDSFVYKITFGLLLGDSESRTISGQVNVIK